MATNPMKRREKNAFLIGFLIALLIMAALVLLVFKMYSDKKNQLEELLAQQKTVVVASKKIDSGRSLTEDDFTYAKVITDVNPAEYYVTVDDLLGEPVEYVDENGNPIEKLDENGEPIEDDGSKEYAVAAKVAIAEGAIVTKDMLMNVDDIITDDVRLNEYSCIALPSQLKNGDFIDVRFTLPTGQDYIVLSKKEVIQTDETTVWIKVNELELLSISGAMVEAWTIPGSRLYAVEYVDAGMQGTAAVTYKPCAQVMDLINADPNIVNEAYKGLAADLKSSRNGSDEIGEYRKYIDEALNENIEDRAKKVEEGFKTENETLQTHRTEYVESLEGTGLVGRDTLTEE